MINTRFAEHYKYEGSFGGNYYTSGQYLMWHCRNMAFFISFFGFNPDEDEVGEFVYITTPEPKFNHYKP